MLAIVAIALNVVAIAAVIFLWRKFMTLEESALSSISFVKNILLESKDSILKVINYQDSFDAKMTALVAAVQAVEDMPASVTNALNDLVDSSKGLSTVQQAVDGIPDMLDAAIARVTPSNG